MKGLQQVPPLPSIYYTRFLTGTSAFAGAAVSAALNSLVEAGNMARKMLASARAFEPPAGTM